MKLKALEISFVEQVSDGILNFNNGNVKANSENRAIEQVENRASEFHFRERVREISSLFWIEKSM